MNNTIQQLGKVLTKKQLHEINGKDSFQRCAGSTWTTAWEVTLESSCNCYMLTTYSSLRGPQTSRLSPEEADSRCQ